METITHSGIVESVGKSHCTVRILQASACSSCSARQLCRSSESKEKLIDIAGHYPTLRAGDSVTLVGTVRQGMHATALAYVAPLVLMLVVLFGGTRLGGEVTGALAALLSLVLYYGIIRLMKDRLGKKFEMKIETNQTDKH